MSLDDTLNPVERAKLAVWDYPVSNKYTKLWETMKLSGFPHSLEEALTSVKNGTFAYIGKYTGGDVDTVDCLPTFIRGDCMSRLHGDELVTPTNFRKQPSSSPLLLLHIYNKDWVAALVKTSRNFLARE